MPEVFFPINNLERSSYVRTCDILKGLSSIEICVSGSQMFNLYEKIRLLPRTGKAVRIDHYNLGLPKQSLADHILTLSVLADTFKSVLCSDVDSRVIGEMAAFHDLAETIIGDVPDFTDKRLAGSNHMEADEKSRKEKWANDMLAGQLPGILRNDFTETMKRLGDTGSPEARFFMMLDKCEPIISVWRYIHIFHAKIEIEKFLEAMDDFFVNPKVKLSVISKDVERLITFLQDKDRAGRYYRQGSAMLDELESKAFTSEIAQMMFSIEMECV